MSGNGLPAVITRETALILPDIDLRRELAALMREHLPGLRLRILDPLPTHPAPGALADVEVLLTFGAFLTDAGLAEAKRLRWIQSLGTGVDGIVDRASLGPGVWVTNARGIHSAPVSETALALMLALARDIPRLVAAQAAHEWRISPAHLLCDKTVGILGVGAIAEGLARRCKAMDMRVEGISSRMEAPFFDRLRPYEELVTAVSDFDYFVLLAPITDQTRHIVDRRVLQAMKPGAFLVNVARGGIVDEDALVEGLKAGRPAAAALDVFATEPLDSGSLLWDLPNALISPHTAGHHRDYGRQVFPILQANWRNFQEGRETNFVNLVRAASTSSIARDTP